MFILKILGKVILLPVWFILVMINILVSVAVKLLSLGKVVSGFIFGILIIATVLCYQDWTQALFLGVLSGIGFLIMFAGVAIELVIETARNRVTKMILA